MAKACNEQQNGAAQLTVLGLTISQWELQPCYPRTMQLVSAQATRARSSTTEKHRGPGSSSQSAVGLLLV